MAVMRALLTPPYFHTFGFLARPPRPVWYRRLSEGLSLFLGFSDWTPILFWILFQMSDLIFSYSPPWTCHSQAHPEPYFISCVLLMYSWLLLISLGTISALSLLPVKGAFALLEPSVTGFSSPLKSHYDPLFAYIIFGCVINIESICRGYWYMKFA